METKTLGEEKISRLLLRFSVPCVTALLISALYSIVDQIFIGHSSLGYLGNAATGVSFPLVCIANAFAWCVGDGAASFLSICAGRRDSDSAHKCVGTGLGSTLLISLALAAVCLAFNEPLMRLFGASEATLGLAAAYFEIIALFFPVYLMANVMNSMIRADGSPAFAMAATVLGAVLNVILDPVFIFLLDWGIRGAAWATVIGQSATLAVCLWYFRRPKTFCLTRDSFRFDGRMLRHLVQMGGSTFITQISVVVMSLLSNMSLFYYGSLSEYGSDIPISVFSVQTKVFTIVINIVVGIALGGQPILGYNYGAGKFDRVRQAYRTMLWSSLAVSAAATLLFELCPQVLIGLFGSGSALYLDFAVKSFRVYLALCVLTSFVKMTSVFFQSIGKSMQAMLASVVRELVCLVGFTLMLCRLLEANHPGQGIFGVLLAAPLSDLVAGTVAAVLTVRFFRSLGTAPAPEQPQAALLPSHPGTVITIARQHGSCGKQIGKLVAQQLGVPFYYKEMTALAAHESGLASRFISELNLNAPAAFHQLYLSTEVVQQAILAQETIIRRIADEGACVIVGRAADYVLRDRPNVLRVFLYAPEEVRERNIMEMYGDTPEEAHLQRARADKARSSYYESISGKNWGSPCNYDLCLDASAGRELCARMITGYLAAREAQRAGQ